MLSWLRNSIGSLLQPRARTLGGGRPSAPQYVQVDANGHKRVLSRYEAGQVTRRDPDFIPRGMGVNALAEQGLDLSVRRSRDLIDNNELIDGAIETRVANIVGCGIDDLEPNTGFIDLDKQIAELTEWAAERVDPDRRRSLAEDQRLCVRELDAAGSVLAYFPMAKAWKGYPAMPAIELIEFERMPLTLSGVVPTDKPGAGNCVRQGVEYDAEGRTVAYHVLTFNPADAGWGSFGVGFSGAWGIGSPNVRRILATEAELIYRHRRVGQLRGIPKTISVMGTIRAEQSFQETCIDQARLAAAMGLFFESPDTNIFRQPDNSEALMVDAMGNPVTRIEGMTLGFVRPGGGLKIATATLPGPTFESTEKILQRRMSRGLNVPYSTLSGDASDTSYASMRGEKLDARSGYEPDQELIFCHHTEPWRRRLIDWALVTGRIVLSAEQAAAFAAVPGQLYRVTPGYPAAGYIDPNAESKARATDIASGVKSQIGAISEDGGNWKRVLDEKVKYAAYLKEQMEKAGITAADLATAAESSKGGGGGDGQDGADGETDGSDEGGMGSGQDRRRSRLHAARNGVRS